MNTLSEHYGLLLGLDRSWRAVEGMELDPFIATQRLKHHEQIPDCPKGRIPDHLSAKQKMARKLRTKKGRETYAKRKE